MKIIRKKISELKEAPYNPRKISKSELEKLKNSIDKWGYVEPIIWNQRTGFVVGGNQRLKVLKEMGFQEVNVVVVDLSPEEEKALNLALNKISGDWDMDKLEEIIKEITKGGLAEFSGFDEKEIREILNNPLENTDYTLKVPAVVYQPLGLDVKLSDCYDDSKYKELLKIIDNAPVKKEIKEFLRLAATRFIEFNFENIAEYYAQAPKEVQELFEKLALVIVDFNRAIEEGFVEMREELMELWRRNQENGEK